ncbi:MAG TPA: Ig domain-containing protein, partial [Desulfuromonadales bacterium]
PARETEPVTVMPVAERETAPENSDQRPPGASPEVFLIPAALTAAVPVQARVVACRDIIRYAWEVNGRLVEGADDPELRPEFYRRGDEVAVRVTCGKLTTTVSTQVRNTAPTIISVPFKNPQVTSGQEIAVLPEALDIDGDSVEFRYLWSVDGEEMPWINEPVLPSEHVRAGREIALTVIPYDRDNEGPAYAGAAFVVPNAPPRFVTSPVSSFQVENYVYAANAVDPDGDTLTYLLEAGPAGMSIDPQTGAVSWRIDAGTVGEHRIRIVAEDPGGLQARQEYTLNLKSQE